MANRNGKLSRETIIGFWILDDVMKSMDSWIHAIHRRHILFPLEDREIQFGSRVRDDVMVQILR